MMAADYLLSPVVAFVVFIGLGAGIYHLAGRMMADGDAAHPRRQTYTGGEAVDPPEGQVQYQAFFWMALLFGIVHMAALVISTLPLGNIPYRLALLYLLGAGAGVFVLSEEEF